MQNNIFAPAINLIISMHSSSAIETIFNEKYVEIKFDRENRVLISEWKGFLLLHEIKTGTCFMIDFIKKEKIEKFFSLQRKMKVLTKDIREYYMNVFNLEIQQAGIKKVAVLVSEDPFAQNTVKKVIDATQFSTLIYCLFDDEGQALHWINE